MYDAIVIGARVAGAPTAMLLARQGHRVLLVDRSTFPSDTMSTHGIPYRGLVKVKQWGLYEKILATNCPEVLKITQDLGDFPLTGHFSKVDGVAALICPRRTGLDKVLVDAAVEAGVEVREGYTVQELLGEDGRITGIKGASRRGTAQMEKARIVIGADGKHSLVARTVQAPTYCEVPPLMCWYYSYWSDLQESPAHFVVHAHTSRVVLQIPTNDHLTCILVGWPIGEFNRVRAHIDQEYHAAIQLTAPLLAEALPHSRRMERYVGTADLPNFFRKPYGPGWALVGDAGYHKDPVNAQGISDAFRDAELLAAAVHAALLGEKAWGDALNGYEQQRNAVAFPLYEQNCQAAAFTPPPADKLRLRAALRQGDQSDIDALFSAVFGTIPEERFFHPTNLARILGETPTGYGTI